MYLLIIDLQIVDSRTDIIMYRVDSQNDNPSAGFRIRIRCFCLDTDPVFKFFCFPIRIRFQISLDSDPRQKECRKGSKSYLLEENLTIMTKDRQKMKKAIISY